MEWTACVGVDWSDQKHAFAVVTASGEEQAGEFGSSPEQVHEWVRAMRSRYAGTIVIGIEQSRGALLYALSAYEFLQLVPINPRAASSYRDSRRLSGAKDDPVDAALIRDFVCKHLNELRVWRSDDPTTRRLRLLVEARRNFVDRRTALVQELTDTLKQYFPQALEWFGTASSAVLRRFIERWPTLEAARAARRDVIERFVRSHSRPSAKKMQAIIESIRTAVSLTDDAALVEPLALRAGALVSLIDTAATVVSQYDSAIAECWSTHPDRALFESFPGAGPVLAPRLAAAFSADRDRYEAASEVQRYSGIAPVIERSGKQLWVHARWRCPKFLRQTFHEFAEASIPKCAWAGAFYRAQRARGAGRHAAIRALAFRWIRILFRCWKSNETYLDARFMEALERRSSPLIAYLVA